MEKKKRGFGSMKLEDIKRIARLGGLAVSQNREHMAKIGSLGGKNSKKNYVKTKS